MTRPEPDLDERGRALHRVPAFRWRKVSSSRVAERSERGAGWPHAPSAAIFVERRSVVVLDSGLHAATSIAVDISIAVQSGGGAIGEKR